MAVQWFRDKLRRYDELNVGDEKNDLLNDIRIKTENLSSAEATELLNEINFKPFLSYLTSDDKQFSLQICSILKTLFNAAEPTEVYQKYAAELFQLLLGADPDVKFFALEELLHTTSNSDVVSQLSRDTNLLIAIISCISEDLKIAQVAMNILKKFGQAPESLKALYSGAVMSSIARLLAKNDVISFRIYDIIVDISILSRINLEASSRSGFLYSLVRVLDNEDILVYLNALEALSRLASTEAGFEYLEQQDILRKLADKVARSSEDPLSNLLIPGLMKFFGTIAHYKPEVIFSNYPTVVSALFEVIESDDVTLLGNALDTLGLVALSVKGKYALATLGDSMFSVLKKIGEVIQKMPTELRVQGLNSLAMMLTVKKEEQDNRILSLVKSWFDALCEEPLELIKTICKLPFADIRQASLEVMAVIASQAWGQEYIYLSPGLIEFLLDRNVEAFADCKLSKYKVVKNLAEAESGILSSETLGKLQKFVNEGPHYVEPYMEVAVENPL